MSINPVISESFHQAMYLARLAPNIETKGHIDSIHHDVKPCFSNRWFVQLSNQTTGLKGRRVEI